MEERWLQTLIDGLHSRYAGNNKGEVANYIPELGKASPDHFAIAIATSDGQVFETGNSDTLFTLQSVSKPFAFGMALEEYG